MTAYHPHILPERNSLLASYAPRPRPGFVARVRSELARLRANRRARRELSGMTAEELRDIGITPGEVDRVFGPEFVHEYARRGMDPRS